MTKLKKPIPKNIRPKAKRSPKPFPADVLAFRQQLLRSISTESPCTHLLTTSLKRAVDWRWQFAGEMHRTGRRLSRFKQDGHIAEACEFIRAALACKTRDRLQQVCDAMPAIYWAYAFFTSDLPNQRWELEARILARESYESIARRFATPPAMIEQYEALFFNVCDRLNNQSWIFHQVIGPKLHYGLQGDDLEVLWKFFAYIGGQHALDAVLACGRQADQPQSMAQVGGYFDSSMRDTMRCKAAVAILTTSIDDPKTALRILKLMQRLQKFDARQREQDVDLAALNAAVDVAMNGFFESVKQGQPFVAGGVPMEQDDADALNGRDRIVLSIVG